jgi:hypothetical protein
MWDLFLDRTAGPVMVMLLRDGAMLIVDTLVGMPFAPTPREAMTRLAHGGLGWPSGLGLAILKLPTAGAARQAVRSPPNRGMSRTAIGCSSASTRSDICGRSLSRSPIPTDEAVARFRTAGTAHTFAEVMSRSPSRQRHPDERGIGPRRTKETL